MIESRADVEKYYEVDGAGTIRSPGKFESEMVYVPYLWEQILSGDGEDVDGQTYLSIEDEDREKFPELEDVTGVYLHTDDFGFVHCYAEEV